MSERKHLFEIVKENMAPEVGGEFTDETFFQTLRDVTRYDKALSRAADPSATHPEPPTAA